MIRVKNNVIKTQYNFWNNCLFHPTDAVEDAWGKRILDRMASDKSIQTIRIYTMLEDIVLMDENGKLIYDFRLNDLRLDYLLKKGYNILLAFGMMPECIAKNKNSVSNVSKNRTRYKGKLINTSVPYDYSLWEEICYRYTKHIIERYGIEVVSKWRLQCFNEPDIPQFFMSDIPFEDTKSRVLEYFKLYTAFANGALRASDKVCVGGPALAHNKDFLKGFLTNIKNTNSRLDFISLHNYAGMSVYNLNSGVESFSVNDWLYLLQEFVDIINECGFKNTELIIDEWGMSACGFYNIEECPAFIARETEVFSAYYVKLIYKLLEKDLNISKLLICLSGQHEMTTDFSGFRNFFTLNFFAKPIYNAFVLASKLHSELLEVTSCNENIFVIPTKNKNDELAVLLTYSLEHFEDDNNVIQEELDFDADISGKNVTIYCIDKNTTNPYRLYEKKGIIELTDSDISVLREEGNLKPTAHYTGTEKIKLNLTPNSVYLITIK